MADTLLFLLIGLPLVAGVTVRFLSFDEEKFMKALLITVSIFAMVGVGYAFSHFHAPPRLFVNIKDFLLIVVALNIAAAFGASLGETEGTATFVKGLLVFLAFLGVWGLLTALDDTNANLIPAISIVVSFCLVGAVYAALGPIGSGFTLSATIHAVSIGEGIDNVFLWKEFFDYFEIGSAPLQVLILIVSSIVGAADTIAAIHDH